MNSPAEPPQGASTSDVPDRPGPARRLYDEIAAKVAVKHPWYTLPKVLGLAELIGIRDTLRQQNLVDTSRLPSVDPVQPPPYDESYLTARTADGSWNDLQHPEMGMASTRFGRNVPPDYTWPDKDRMMVPNPREISLKLMTRDTFNAAAAGNALITAWLQFMLHDWVKHGTSPKENPWILPQVEGDDWPAPPVVVMRVPPDPTAPADSTLPPTHLNVNTHWWDGSSIYGNDLQQQRFLREGAGGRLRLADGLPPIPPGPEDDPALVPGFWLGLGMMYALFSMEHNSIAATLAAAHPEFDDETLFQKARLITCALIAKIHTVEWTPAVTAHPTAVEGLYANWWGLAGQKLHNFVATISKNEALRGIPGTHTEDYGVPYSLTEEFVAVYRMHPLVPDDFDFRSARDDAPTLGPRSFSELTGPQAVPILRNQRLTDLIYTFGTMNPGLVTLHNYPKGLQTFKRPDNGAYMDMAALDILRCRELGVPRYREFRRLLHMPVPQTFEEVTSNKVWAKELHDVYGGKIEDLDLIPGLMAEDLPEGFAFSDTAFRIFILMASRRLNSDRFFTDSFTDEVYTSEGMRWIADNTMRSVLARHCPDLEPTPLLHERFVLHGVGRADRPRDVERQNLARPAAPDGPVHCRLLRQSAAVHGGPRRSGGRVLEWQEVADLARQQRLHRGAGAARVNTAAAAIVATAMAATWPSPPPQSPASTLGAHPRCSVSPRSLPALSGWEATTICPLGGPRRAPPRVTESDWTPGLTPRSCGILRQARA